MPTNKKKGAASPEWATECRSMLLLDIGNSRIKWARAEGDKLAGRGQIDHRGRTLDGHMLSAAIDASLTPSRVVAACVAGSEIEALLTHWARGRFGLNVEYLQSPAETAGVRNAYAKPSELGVDRWLAVVAAFHLYGASLVVDAGTALTIDAVDASGVHLGGLIAPGAGLMKASLFRDTHKLREAGDAPATPFATDTAAAIGSGAHFALTGLIERAIDHLEGRLQSKFALVITGGDAKSLAGSLPSEFRVVDDLVLRGALIMAAESDS